MRKYFDLDLMSPLVDESCKTITREIMRAGHPDDSGGSVPMIEDLRTIADNFHRYSSRGGVVPVTWLGTSHLSDRAGEVVGLAVEGNSLFATVAACGDCRNLSLLRDLPNWNLRVAKNFRDDTGNVYPLHLLNLTANKPASPSSPPSRNLSLNSSKENDRMARNYALVKRHILPNRADWMRANVKHGKRVRSLAIASDPNGDTLTVEDFCRWWNMLCSSMLDPDAENYVFSSVPGTAEELRVRMQVIEEIIKKRTNQANAEELEQMKMQQGNAPAGVTLQNLSLKQRAIRSLSIQQQALNLAMKVRKSLLPYRDLSEEDQDARQRAFWGK